MKVRSHHKKSRRETANGNPLVSIITVCRNSENTIRRTIESVLRQSYSHIEYLIVDGASGDGTTEIIKEYESKFCGRLTWSSEKDGGVYDAMNKGIRLSSGSIIGIINADDWYEDRAVEQIVRASRGNNDAVYHGIMRCTEDGEEVMLRVVNAKFFGRVFDGHPTFFVCRSLYDKYGLFNTNYRYAADYELMMRFLSRNVQFIQVDRVVANFSLGGLSSQRSTEVLIDNLRIRHAYGHISARQLFVNVILARVAGLLRKARLLV